MTTDNWIGAAMGESVAILSQSEGQLLAGIAVIVLSVAVLTGRDLLKGGRHGFRHGFRNGESTP